VKALAKAGLRIIRIHDLRHTYASLLIQNGESLAYVRDQLGSRGVCCGLLFVRDQEDLRQYQEYLVIIFELECPTCF